MTRLNEDEVRRLIRKHADKAGSVRALAAQWKISQSALDKQLRGEQAIGEKVLVRLGLIRRKLFRFYSTDRRGITELAIDAGLRILEHSDWREATHVIQKEPGSGDLPLAPGQVARMLGIRPRDLARIMKLDCDFPRPDATSESGVAAWSPGLIYAWLKRKARRRHRDTV